MTYSHDLGFNGVEPARYGMMRDNEKRQLRRQSNRTGLCLVAFTCIQLGVVGLLRVIPNALYLYSAEPVFADMLEMLIYLCSMLLPFLVAYRCMNPDEREDCGLFEKPVSAWSAAAAVGACFFFCTIGDFATNYLLDFLEQLGFSVGGGTYDPATNLPDMFGELLLIAVLPALVEEFAMRCIVLQPMRRFGDRYAVLMSAFVFALMHGNLVQIPFAFVAGIAFGYYVVATGSIWVGVLAHFLNNAYSVVLNYLVETTPEAANRVYQLTISITLVFGLLCVVLFWKVCPHQKLQKKTTALSGGEKTAVYLFTVPMVIAVLRFIISAVELIDFVGV